MRYVRMWYIIRHTKTKIIARVHTAHGTRHACRLFFWDVSIRNSLRSNNRDKKNHDSRQKDRESRFFSSLDRFLWEQKVAKKVKVFWQLLVRNFGQ